MDTENPEDNPAAVLIDTITAYIGVRTLDSFATASSNVALAGFHDDPFFGRILSQPYFRLSLPAEAINIPANSSFDSMQLMLRYNKYYYGDTLQPVRLQVYKLTEKIEKGDRTDFFNTTSFQYQANASGQYYGLAYPNRTDSLGIPMDAAWGQELFTKLKNKATEVSTEDEFNNYLYGLTIVPDTTITKSIVGFKATDSQLVMRLYYHVNDVVTRNEVIEFPLKENTTQFNHIRINRQQTELKKLPAANIQVSSKTLSNTAYVQPLTGITSLISFPSLAALKEQGKFVSILKATLIIRPVRASYVNYPLPERLILREEDQYGRQGSELYDASGLSIQYGNLQTDDIYHINTYYQYDLTGYMQQQLAAGVYESTYLSLLPPPETTNTEFTRVVFGNRDHEYRIELKLYMLIYK